MKKIRASLKCHCEEAPQALLVSLRGAFFATKQSKNRIASLVSLARNDTRETGVRNDTKRVSQSVVEYFVVMVIILSVIIATNVANRNGGLIGAFDNYFDKAVAGMNLNGTLP